MKTKEKRVTVEVECAGKRRRFNLSIRNQKGELMTHRLKQIATGYISARTLSRLDSDIAQAVRTGDGDAVRFIGIVWKPPYTILQEVLQDRLQLQEQLKKVDEFQNEPESLYEVTVIPEKADNAEITRLLIRELKARRTIKSRIKTLSKRAGR